MNREQLERIRKLNIQKLDIAYRSNLNRIEYNLSESVEHFFAKTICFVLLRHGIPAQSLEKIDMRAGPCYDVHMKIIKEIIRKWGVKFKHEWERPMVVCEARTKKEGKWDLFLLDTGERIEIVESSDKAKVPYKDDKNVIKVII